MKRIIVLAVVLALMLGGCASRGKATRAPEVFVEPDAGPEPILKAMRDARSSIDLVTYLFTSEQMLDSLAEATGRGVKVRVMLEPHPYGEKSNFEEMRQRMTQAGIKVKAASPAFHLTHEKAMVVDGKTAWVMTNNMTDSAFKRNREFMVELFDPAMVEEIEQVFDADWNRNLFTPIHPDMAWGPENARDRLESFIQLAESSIYMEEEEFLDEEVLSLLVGAINRGVEVRLIMPQVRLDQGYDKVLVQKLRDAGGEVVGVKSPFIHAKMILVDDTMAVVGSINLSPASMDTNRELSVFLTDPHAIDVLERTFDKDWRGATQPSHPTPEEIKSSEAREHIGEEVTITGKVVSVFKGEKATFLHIGASDFVVVVFAEDERNFPFPLEEMYMDRVIRVHGVIKTYHDQPGIIIHSPDQIEVLP